MVVELMPKFSPFSPKVVAGQWIEMRLCAQMKAPHDQIGRDTLTRLIIVLISFRSFLDWYNKWMVLDGHRRKTCPKICIAMNGRSGQVTDAWLTAKRTNETNYGVSIYIFDNRIYPSPSHHTHAIFVATSEIYPLFRCRSSVRCD